MKRLFVAIVCALSLGVSRHGMTQIRPPIMPPLLVHLIVDPKDAKTPLTEDFEDFFAFAEAFGSKKGEPYFNVLADADDDGVVDFDDFFLFADAFGRVAVPPYSFPFPIPSLLVSSGAFGEFNDTGVGSTSQQTISLRNLTASDLSVEIAMAGEDADQFQVSPTKAAVPASGFAILTVTFAPTYMGVKSASLSVIRAAESPLTVSLLGEGIFGTRPLTPRVGDGTAEIGIGDQKVKRLDHVRAGQKIDIPIFCNQEVAGAYGFQVELKFDPGKLSGAVSWKKGEMFSTAVDLPAQTMGNTVVYGAAFLGKTATVRGPFAMLSFQTEKDFSGETEIVLKSLSVFAHGAKQDLRPQASVVLSGEGFGVFPAPDARFRRAIVVATVTQDGRPAAGLEVAFSRSVSGLPPDDVWRGITDAGGRAVVEIVSGPGPFWRTGATGYYRAQAVHPASRAVVGEWGNIPINGRRQTVLALPVGGQARIEGVSALDAAVPFTLNGNAPNPFNPATQIAYHILEPGEVFLTVYNLMGQRVRTLVRAYQEAGFHSVTWDGRDDAGRAVSSGSYFYRLSGRGWSETKRMVLLK